MKKQTGTNVQQPPGLWNREDVMTFPARMADLLNSRGILDLTVVDESLLIEVS